MTLLGVLHQGETLPGTVPPDRLSDARLSDLEDVVRHVPSFEKGVESSVTDSGSDQRLMREIAEADPEKLRLIVQEAKAVRKAAGLLGRVMAEFVEDGEPFPVQEDAGFKDWLDGLLRREVHGLNTEDRALLLDSLLGFPPATPAEVQYGNERVERTREVLTGGVETSGATGSIDWRQAA